MREQLTTQHSVWVCLDGNGMPQAVFPDPTMCHDHINDMVGVDLDGAASWVVREFVQASQSSYADTATDLIEKLRKHGGFPVPIWKAVSALEASLRQPARAEVGEWVMVPREATAKMREAAMKARNNQWNTDEWDRIDAQYEAMLAAAPCRDTAQKDGKDKRRIEHSTKPTMVSSEDTAVIAAIHNHFHQQCCECGLTHRIEIERRKNGDLGLRFVNLGHNVDYSKIDIENTVERSSQRTSGEGK